MNISHNVARSKGRSQNTLIEMFLLGDKLQSFHIPEFAAKRNLGISAIQLTRSKT
jgi:hypothetical protein